MSLPTFVTPCPQHQELPNICQSLLLPVSTSAGPYLCWSLPLRAHVLPAVRRRWRPPPVPAARRRHAGGSTAGGARRGAGYGRVRPAGACRDHGTFGSQRGRWGSQGVRPCARACASVRVHTRLWVWVCGYVGVLTKGVRVLCVFARMHVHVKAKSLVPVVEERRACTCCLMCVCVCACQVARLSCLPVCARAGLFFFKSAGNLCQERHGDAVSR